MHVAVPKRDTSNIADHANLGYSDRSPVLADLIYVF